MILVESFHGRGAADHPVEIVERKGKGHPDTLCDGVMEAISLALCRAYLERFGTILHHNIDKGLLAAGQVERHFGGGRVLRPMELIIGDRASAGPPGEEIPVEAIAVSEAKRWLGGQLRQLDPERHLRCRPVLAPGSEELTGIFQGKGRVLAANDTSAAVGYHPLSPTETLVLELEGYLNSAGFKERFPETGEDVKIMGVRRYRRFDLTVAMPLLAACIPSEDAYFERKEAVLDAIRDFVAGRSWSEETVVHFNHLDRRGRGEAGTYLSLLGTSAEDADSGQVGRGNRVNGLISLNRPLGTEAAAGKNPVSHVGKIYNVLAHRLAREIYEEIDGIGEVQVLLVGRIGEPVDRPALVSVQLLLAKGRTLEDSSRRVRELVAASLKGMEQFCLALARGDFPVC